MTETQKTQQTQIFQFTLKPTSELNEEYEEVIVVAYDIESALKEILKKGKEVINMLKYEIEVINTTKDQNE
jgi:hypothetical protein